MSIFGNGKIHFSFPQNLELNTVLFEETNKYRQYSYLPPNFIEEYEVEFKVTGFNTGYLCTHI